MRYWRQDLETHADDDTFTKNEILFDTNAESFKWSSRRCLNINSDSDRHDAADGDTYADSDADADGYCTGYDKR